MEEWSIKASEKIMSDLIRLMRVPMNKRVKEMARGENMLLFFALHNPGVSPKQISDFSAVSTARVARMLKHLEEQGYIERRGSPDDKRGVEVYLTEEGDKKIRQQYELARKYQINLLEMLGQRDCEEMARIINKAVEVAEKLGQEE